MNWIWVFLSSLLVFQYLLVWILAKKNWKTYSKKVEGDKPIISVLIAVRNEEKYLPRLLKSLEQLEYPAQKLEILIADDQSNDATPELLRQWASISQNRKILTVLADQTGLFHPNGKANALAILAKEAKGEFYFFTDADCEVPSTWILEGISCFRHGVGLVIGITQVRSRDLFGKMQELDWWNTLGLVKVVTDLGFSTTGLGNNMMISKEAYDRSGGFSVLPFSLTEDLEISRAVRKGGFRLVHQINPRLLVKTKAEPNWKALLQQRKRWMNGVITLSFGWKILLGLQFLFFPVTLILIIQNPAMGFGVWGIKVLVQGLFLQRIAAYAHQTISLSSRLLFDFYQILTLSLTILYYFWPSQTQWKSRKYP
jgi:cellulose synthase/poly-beta-1,6-N-acetylglucosamine synthase-like glycosyltransferase